jgi:hypothetical protein
MLLLRERRQKVKRAMKKRPMTKRAMMKMEKKANSTSAHLLKQSTK